MVETSLWLENRFFSSCYKALCRSRNTKLARRDKAAVAGGPYLASNVLFSSDSLSTYFSAVIFKLPFHFTQGGTQGSSESDCSKATINKLTLFGVKSSCGWVGRGQIG